MNDSVNSRGNLRDSLREVSIVVISIPIAFSLDAWWDSWRDTERESELLVALKHDFEQIRALLHMPHVECGRRSRRPGALRISAYYLTIGKGAGILDRMNAELNTNLSWWWLPRKEWVAG